MLEAEAIKMANDIDEEFKRTGYMLWFATWHDENGQQHDAHPENGYTR
jgi:hypothetical protein